MTGVERDSDRHWALFVDWCTATGRTALPATPDTVTAFVAEMVAGPATITRRLHAIDTAHQTAGLVPPLDSRQLDGILGRHRAPPRFDPDLVAEALEAITIGGWPAGIVGRRDAAVVALICAAGLTRTQTQELRTPTAQSPPLGSRHDPRAPNGCGDPPVLLAVMARTGRPGCCPVCALTRWQRVATYIDTHGWRAVRAWLADYGETPASAETVHDCTQPLPPPSSTSTDRPAPLICAIDRHGTPETGYRISTRTLTAIVARRLQIVDKTDRDDRQPDQQETQEQEVSTAGQARRWAPEDRRRERERFAELEGVLDRMEAQAETILAKLNVPANSEPGGKRNRSRADQHAGR